MTLTRCGSGHFYDEDKFDRCPHCMASRQIENETVALFRNNDVTIATSNKAIGIDPVVGWLVCVEGTHLGEDFRLRSGRNAIGRATGMDVSIVGDSSVSRENHAFVIYDPQTVRFTALPGNPDALCYLNENPLLSAALLEVGDVLAVGATRLMFFPCCTSSFHWNPATGEQDAKEG